MINQMMHNDVSKLHVTEHLSVQNAATWKIKTIWMTPDTKFSFTG